MTCIELNNKLITHTQAFLPHTVDESQFGYSDPNSLLSDKRLSSHYLSSYVRSKDLANTYLRSYLSAASINIGHIRDLLVSLLYTAASRPVQYRDTSLTKLTHFAQYYFSTQSPEDAWANYKSFSNQQGIPGSVLYWSTSNEQLDITERVREASSNIFNSLSLTGDTPKEIHLSYEELYKDVPVLAYYAGLEKLYKERTRLPDPVLNPLKVVRRNLMSTTDWVNLRQRLLVGEISSQLREALSQIYQSSLDASSIGYFDIAIKSKTSFIEGMSQTIVLGVAGPSLIYQALGCLSLVNLIETINENLGDSLDMAYTQFLKEPSFEQIRFLMAGYCAGAYDAWAALALFGTTYEARSYSYRFFLKAVQLLANNPVRTLPADSDDRIFSFTQA